MDFRMITNSKIMSLEQRQARFLIAPLRVFLIVLTPLLLVLFNARLAMNPLFLEFEYNRPGFPVDFYGMTREERLEYAPYLLDYLFNDADIDYLSALKFPNGTLLFNDRELRHMLDVKIVTRFAFAAGSIAAVLAVIAAAALWRIDAAELRRALMTGAVFTLALLAGIVVLALFAWDIFFTSFHNMFFEAGTWQFLYSDTLIRLFPEQLWFDAALLVGGLTVIEAALVWVGCRVWERRSRAR